MAVRSLTIHLPADLWRSVQALAPEEGDANTVILRALEDYVTGTRKRRGRARPGKYQKLVTALSTPVAALHLSARPASALQALNIRYVIGDVASFIALCSGPLTMPRGPRLDAPETLHHVMVRGIEGRAIFRDDQDRDDFVRRLGEVVIVTGLTVYAWALLPNHLHLLVRTGATPLAQAMRSLLTGYAGAFNRRHRRRGHLFQNRYKSVVVELEPYLLELVRYIHLNPLRAKVVADLRVLERYPYTGHAVLLGRRRCPWQDTGSILGQFAARRGRARLAYRAFVSAGIPQGRRPDLQGGGLVRSLGGWAAVQALRRGREHCAGDERVLGSPAFVEALQRELAARPAARRPPVPLAAIVRRVCAAMHLTPAALQEGSRRPVVCRAREGIAYLARDVGGYPAPRLVAHLGVRPPSISKAAQRGRADRARWDRVWNAGKN